MTRRPLHDHGTPGARLRFVLLGAAVFWTSGVVAIAGAVLWSGHQVLALGCWGLSLHGLWWGLFRIDQLDLHFCRACRLEHDHAGETVEAG